MSNQADSSKDIARDSWHRFVSILEDFQRMILMVLLASPSTCSLAKALKVSREPSTSQLDKREKVNHSLFDNL